jgi:nicotinate dehydrogenase subunit B
MPSDGPRWVKRAWLDANGLLVLRGADTTDPNLFVAIAEDGAVTAFCGHVDLGTGIATALAQIVAEELDVAFTRVAMVLGDTGLAPDQGATIASETIQVTAVPLRRAAAQARAYLVAKAAAELRVPVDALSVDDGYVSPGDGSNRGVGYAELLAGKRVVIELAEDVAVKPVSSYRIVGQPVPRSDLPAKASGAFTYVHDVRVPGMWHGRVIRPPYAGRDVGSFVGTSLIAVDRGTLDHLPYAVELVVIGDFVGLACAREEQAVEAAATLRVRWKDIAALPDLGDVAAALRANPATPRTLIDRGDVAAARAGAAKTLERSYVWPYQMHASIGPSCAVADWREDGLAVWSGTQNPHALRADLARLVERPEAEIEIVRHEAAGCYGRNCADDVAGDAALMSRALRRPVRVQLTRQQEHAWEPKGAAQVMDVAGALDAAGDAVAYEFATRYPSNGAPLLALLLTGREPPVPQIFPMGDRTAIPPYDYPALRVVVHDMAPIVRAAWLRGVSALPNSFAHESFIDELAIAAGADPVEYRLRYLKDERAVALVKAVADRAGWIARTAARRHMAEDGTLRGQGFAYALYVHSAFPGFGAAWSAWVADVSVNPATGEVKVARVTVGQDSGLMINPAGVQHQIHGNVIQATSRALKEEVAFTETAVASREWGAYPIITFPEVPTIDVLLMPRPNDPPLGSGESASVPSAAAIANAIYDATGVRFREPPFTPERVKAALAGASTPAKKPRRFGFFAGMVTAALGIAAAALPWRGAIAPIAPPDPATYAPATIARGKILAALGNCAVCHTAEDGLINAGGRALETPFGIVYATNITPDVATGIGGWSYAAFERAMREGVSRDGHHLYPAFPYTAFAKISDADMLALYAYLMAQPAVAATAPATKLAFPFNVRPLLAGWNALFLRSDPRLADAARSAQWNRGAYLVETLGHCGACHSPRNALGAEKARAFLAGGWAEGWEAPPLTDAAYAPVPWTEDELYAYLRTGQSRHHGTAAGPMAAVVQDLARAPPEDVRAMAVYLASLAASVDAGADEAVAVGLEAASRVAPAPASFGARLFAGACGACHEGDAPPLFGLQPSLALNSNVHSPHPDNVIQAVLHGVDTPFVGEHGAMPGFGHSLSDEQIADVARYVRARFAPGKPAWEKLEGAVARLRSAAH